MTPSFASVRELDVRPILAKGGDPFSLILKTVQSLAAGEALHLVAPFEPVPLYAVLRSMGYASRHEERDGVHHVWFHRDGGGGMPAEPVAGDDEAPLQPAVELDVRGLEPPAPMMTILEKLVELGPGAQLLVRHHREPVLLYEKLQLRGYAARAKKVCDGDWIVHIAPAHAFEEPR
jgi:uncharacterized protein (DUF2249 family)